MLAYVCDTCKSIISSKTAKVDRDLNPAFLIGNFDYTDKTETFHMCYKCAKKCFSGEFRAIGELLKVDDVN